MYKQMGQTPIPVLQLEVAMREYKQKVKQRFATPPSVLMTESAWKDQVMGGQYLILLCQTLLGIFRKNRKDSFYPNRILLYGRGHARCCKG
jgi:hypothetical protein